MWHKKKSVFLIIFLSLAVSAYCEDRNPSGRYLTQQDIQCLREAEQLLCGIDKKSLQQTIDDLEKTRYPRVNLQIRQAMAKTYADLVRDYQVTGQKKKEWLYSMVCLNMAYIQFGGGQGNPENSTSLNRLIYRKLKEYLPPNILKQRGLLYSLE